MRVEMLVSSRNIVFRLRMGKMIGSVGDDVLVHQRRDPRPTPSMPSLTRVEVEADHDILQGR